MFLVRLLLIPELELSGRILECFSRDSVSDSCEEQNFAGFSTSSDVLECLFETSAGGRCEEQHLADFSRFLAILKCATCCSKSSDQNENISSLPPDLFKLLTHVQGCSRMDFDGTVPGAKPPWTGVC